LSEFWSIRAGGVFELGAPKPRVPSAAVGLGGFQQLGALFLLDGLAIGGEAALDVFDRQIVARHIEPVHSLTNAQSLRHYFAGIVTLA
jgi:hypothetical protein